MIDSTTSPVPAWKRYAIMVVLAVLVVVAGYVIYTKELHHSSSGSNAGSPPATSPAPATSGGSRTGKPSSAVPTTIPGGVPVSSRNPFAA